ncbi:MAG: hypothetical protein LBM87_05595 [Ruminococcus sp.]|jgi:hypothetical protein|nr:hypothetical protein [Ruminococcus sp.]
MATDFNQKNMEQLLGILAAKTGVPKEQLQEDFKNGSFDNAINGMNPKQRSMFNAVLKNPKIIQSMVSSPQAKSLLNQLKQK